VSAQASRPRGLGSVSIDVDTLYSLFQGYSSSRDVVFDHGMPRFLELMESLKLRATLFVVGQDMRRSARARALIREAAEKGHEIANHTDTHFQGLCRLSSGEQRREIVDAGQLLEEVTGQKVVGFRAPGWNVSAVTLDILEENGYLYDSSVMPTWFSLPLKLLHWHATRGLGDRRKRTTLGSPLHMLAPPTPYRPGPRIWRRGNRRLLEVPVSVVPFLRLPFFGTFSLLTGPRLFALSYAILRLRGWPVNYELHGVEFVDGEGDGVAAETAAIGRQYVPATLGRPYAEKRAALESAMRQFQRDAEMVPLRELVGMYDAPPATASR